MLRLVAAAIRPPPSPSSPQESLPPSGGSTLRAAVALLTVLLLTSCRTTRTEVVVIVDSDLPWGQGRPLAGLLVTVRSGGPTGTIRDARAYALGTTQGTFALPASFGVVPLDGNAQGTFWVEVVGCSGAACSTTGTPDALVTQRALVGFVPGQTLALHMFLSTACAHVQCGVNETCAPQTGQCRSALVDASELVPFVPGSERDAHDIASPDALDATDVPVSTSRVAQVECASANTCVRLEDSSVWCWGDNALAIVNDDSATQAALRPIRRMAPEGPVVATSIASGGETLCVLDAAAHVRCLGLNNRGQLGTGVPGFQSSTFGMVALEGVRRVDVSDINGCAIHGAGALSCWGANDGGQLGVGGTGDSAVPIAVALPAQASDVSVGLDHICAATADHRVYCWGGNGRGQLGDGTNTARTAAAPVQGLVDAVDVEAGDYFTCALRAGGTVSCWGYAGQNGAAMNTNAPRDVPGLAGVTSLSAGRDHVCAVTSDHRVHCWGNNYSGALGVDTGSTEVPASSPTAGDVVSVSCGEQHTCAIRTTGELVCWGSDTYGQLGNGRSTAFTGTPVAVPMTPTGFTALAVGQAQVAFGLVAGQAYSFGLGAGHGELGPGLQGHGRMGRLGANDASAGGEVRGCHRTTNSTTPVKVRCHTRAENDGESRVAMPSAAKSVS